MRAKTSLTMALNTSSEAGFTKTEDLRLVLAPYELFVTAFWHENRLIRLNISQAPTAEQEYNGDSHLADALTGLLTGQIHNLEFPIPYTARGSRFSVEVWTTLLSLPYGHTLSYKELAQILQTSPRAIGQALKANPLPIIIPCHRVLGSHGELTGFSCGLEIKKILLAIEDRQRRAHENSHYIGHP